jgi:hypothetical protein
VGRTIPSQWEEKQLSLLYGKQNNSHVVTERRTIILVVLERRTTWHVYFYFMEMRTILALLLYEKKNYQSVVSVLRKGKLSVN